MESILTSIKKMLGIDEDYEHFDVDIIIQINMVFNVLSQLGVGPEKGFYITDKSQTWSDYISDMSKLEMVKTYVYLKVRLIFDAPMSSAVAQSYQSQISELEWRLNVQVDPEKGNVL